MKKQLTARQTGLILIVSILANKLLMLPGIISVDAKQNAWLVFFASFVVDFLFLMIFLYVSSKIDVPIFEYLQKRFGNAVAILFAIPIIITFVFKTVDIFGECYLFFEQVMYVKIDQIIFMACFAIMILYLGSRAFRTLGRTIELVFFVFVISLFLCLYMSIGSVNTSNLFPVFQTQPTTFFYEIFSHNLWFGDFLAMFLLVGNIKTDKNTNRHIMIDYLIGVTIVLMAVVIFTCVFGNTAPMHKMAIIEITEYTPRLTTEGRLNWLIDLIFPFVNILGLGIYANMGTKALEFCLPKKIATNIIAVTIFAGLVFASALIINISYPNLYALISEYVCYISAFAQYILPIFLILLLQKKEMKYDKKTA